MTVRSDATDGLLLVDKPAGVTSHDVAAVARRVVGARRVGHAGTLDPFATGLLVLLLGHATRLAPYLDGEPKVYDATIRFGAQTDTDDLTGAVVRTAAPPDRDAVLAALRTLTGTISQLPPAYSAKQVGGRRAYAAARQGEPLALAPATVIVHEWIVRDWHGDDLDVSLSCSTGTYVRALARDAGERAGSAAHLASLRRTGAGRFRVDHAISWSELRAGHLTLRPPLEAVAALPREVLGAADVARVKHGRSVVAIAPGERAALVDPSGALLAVAVRSGLDWHPRVVLADG